MEHFVQVTTTGSAGSATGTGTTQSVLRGFIVGIQVDYHTSAPATTDVTIAESAVMARTVLTLSNNATDVVKYPMAQAQDTTGVAIAGVYLPFYIPGVPVTVSVAQCDALTNAVTVRIHTVE